MSVKSKLAMEENMIFYLLILFARNLALSRQPHTDMGGNNLI